MPTVGHRRRPVTTGQVLCGRTWLGLRGGKMATFVKQYADLRSIVTRAATAYHQDVLDGTFPGPEHEFERAR